MDLNISWATYHTHTHSSLNDSMMSRRCWKKFEKINRKKDIFETKFEGLRRIKKMKSLNDKMLITGWKVKIFRKNRKTTYNKKKPAKNTEWLHFFLLRMKLAPINTFVHLSQQIKVRYMRSIHKLSPFDGVGVAHKTLVVRIILQHLNETTAHCHRIYRLYETRSRWVPKKVQRYALDAQWYALW